MNRLHVSLQDYNVSALQAMAEHLSLQINDQTVRKARLVGELSRLIPQLARSRKFIRSLSEAERAALAIALTKDENETLRMQDIAPPLILADLVSVEGQNDARSRPTVDDVVTHLLHMGFLINAENNHYVSSTLRTLDFVLNIAMPSEVRSALPADLLSVPEPAVERLGLDDVNGLRIETSPFQQYLRSLFFTWAELRRKPARLLKAGDMGKRDRRRIAEALSMDPASDAALDQVGELDDMLRALKLVTAEDDTIAAVEGDAVTLFWNTTPSGQLPALMRAYTRLQAGYSDVLGEYAVGGYLESVHMQPGETIRNRVIEVLSQIAPLEWVSIELFIGLATGGQPGSLTVGHEWLAYLYRGLRWYGGSYRREMENELQEIDLKLVGTILRELHTIGLIDLAYKDAAASSGDRLPRAVRANAALREYHASRTAPSSAETPWQVILQPDFQMLALGPVPMRVLANLEQFTLREKIDESVITYRIQREEAYQAFQRGESVESVLGYLEEATDQPVPQNVIRSLREWYEQYERIVVRRRVCIVQLDSAELMAALKADAVVSEHLHEISDTLAWILPQDRDLLKDRLLEMEMLPAHSGQAAADVRNSLQWQDEGLAPRARVPSVYVTGSLRRIAEPHNGVWRLTPESTQRATALGLDAATIIEMLEGMTGTEVPDDWQQRLKAWGHHFGSGQVNQVRLLRLKREGALEELRDADRRLHRWLRPLPGTSDLAIVNEHHWEETQQLLEAWGIQVDSERWW